MDVSFQLYSARDAGPWDATLKMLAEAGYADVEGFGAVYRDPGAFLGALDRHGLRMSSGHFYPLQTLEDDLNAPLERARMLGIERVICPAPDEALRAAADRAAWMAFVKRLEAVGKRVRDAGLRFGWHNHHWEFHPLEDGSLPMDLVLEHAPTLEWEMDVAWIVRGGADPFAWIARHADRVTAAHVKDIAPEGTCADEDGWADVGHGTLGWPALMVALRKAGGRSVRHGA